MVINKVNYVGSLEFAIRASAITTTFQQSIETILKGLPIASISGNCTISLLRLQ